MTTNALRPSAIVRFVTPALFWCVVLALAIGSYGLTNDQFHRISLARNIAVHGELPFRDYFDPGFYLTELSSAALQRLLGYNLLGELLLNTMFIATGSLLVLLLVRRVSGSTAAGIAAALIAFSSMPRAYDYDKVLFYPLGIFVLWRYLDRPGLGRLIGLAATIVIAGLFRYDNGVYVGVAALVAILVVHGFSRLALRETVQLTVAIALVSGPALVFVQVNGGLADAIDQMLTYGAREGARTRLTSVPRFVMGRWLSIDAPSAGQKISIRWSAQVDAVARAEATSRLGLVDETERSPEARTWSYLVADESTEHIRRIVNDPAVEDTAGIDRGRMTLEHPTSMWSVWARHVPLMRLRLLPDFEAEGNAGAVLFYVLVALPIAALVVLLVARRTMTRTEIGGIAGLIVMTALLDLLILREPIGARVGGLAGPPAVLGAWLASWAFRRGWVKLASVVTGVVVLAVLIACSIVVGWSRQLMAIVDEPRRVLRTVQAMSAPPPALDVLPSGRDEKMILYVNRCTLATDRVYASWFFPDLYWFAQRSFAGGMVVTFGEHWSEPRFQERIVRAFQSQSVPLVLMRAGDVDDIRRSYPIVHAYLRSQYHLGGTSNFGDPSMAADAYHVFVANGRPAVRLDAEWGLPCFA